jgi:plastocyanin
MSRRHAALLPAVLALLLAAGAGCGGDDDEPLLEPDSAAAIADYEYLIPEGTADRIKAFEQVEIIPARLEASVGEVIRIVNDDDEGHFVGIFYVGPGETVTQRFASAGEFKGNCTIHPSGEIALIVRE